MRFKKMKDVARDIQQKLDHMWGLADETETGKPYLSEREGILALNFDAMSVQSEMYIDRPDELVIPYTRAMMSFLLLHSAPARIAMIGLGGGSIAKYCHRYLPCSEMQVVEISPEVIALRNEFAIPVDDARFRVLQDDGAAWVHETQWQPDVLILDGFDTDGLPARLSSQHFYDDCFLSLDESGVLVVNLWGGYPHYERSLARISNSFSGRVLVFDSDDGVNKIVLAMKSNSPSVSTIRENAARLALTHPLDFQNMANRLICGLPDGLRRDMTE